MHSGTCTFIDLQNDFTFKEFSLIIWSIGTDSNFQEGYMSWILSFNDEILIWLN